MNRLCRHPLTTRLVFYSRNKYNHIIKNNTTRRLPSAFSNHQHRLFTNINSNQQQVTTTLSNHNPVPHAPPPPPLTPSPSTGGVISSSGFGTFIKEYGTAVVALFGIIGASYYANEANRLSKEANSITYKIKTAADKFESSTLDFPNKLNHVERVTLENEVKSLIAQEQLWKDKKIFVVNYGFISGTRGTGKSELIDAALSNVKGVFKINLNTNNANADTVERRICNEFGLGDSTEHFRAFIALLNKRNIYPKFIIEIDEQVTMPEEVMNSLISLARELCWNSFKCMIIIVPSDNALATSSSSLLSVAGRSLLIWVGEMEVKEAKILMANNSFTMDGATGIKSVDDAYKSGGVSDGYEELFKRVGLHPLTLANLCGKRKEEREKFIQDLEDGGAMAWKICLDKVVTDDPHTKLMRAQMKSLAEQLLVSESGAVSIKNLSSPIISPDTLTTFMKAKKSVVFIYHPPSKSYRFHDIFVERAVRKWKEEELRKEEEMRSWWSKLYGNRKTNNRKEELRGRDKKAA